MTPGRRLLVLTLLGVALVAVAVVVLVRNRSPDDELLAVAALIGGLAILVTNMPTPEA